MDDDKIMFDIEDGNRLFQHADDVYEQIKERVLQRLDNHLPLLTPGTTRYNTRFQADATEHVDDLTSRYGDHTSWNMIQEMLESLVERFTSELPAEMYVGGISAESMMNTPGKFRKLLVRA